ncbi:MAG TPA: DNA polymerase III subunit beta [Thermoanaerobaculia bacterium]|jgi:DNA polymerase-3 subunit beta|nr:DNA polymerase III subunit beta [Thermoanaerobaculia bacterium]
MEIRLKRNDFLGELAPMQGIVERKTTIPVLSHILLDAKDSLHLAATDLDVSLTSRCEAEIKEGGAIAVQAKKLIEIIRSLSASEVLLVQEEPRVLSIRAGSSRFKIHGLAADDFPTLPTLPAGSGSPSGIEIPFADFRRMVAKILFAVSAEESRFQLNGALFKVKDGSLEIVATDGHRLALVEKREQGLRNGTGEESVLVPRKALQELQRLEGDSPASMLEFRRGEHHLSFRLGRRELICRILEGTFPDYERVIAKDNDKKVLFDRKTLAEAVQRAALMTSDRARAVRLQFSSRQLVISAVNADLGEAVEEVACEYEGPEFRLGINPDYLSQFLAAVETDRVRLELKDENTQCVGYPQDPPVVGTNAEAGADGADVADAPKGAGSADPADGATASSGAPAEGNARGAAANGRYLCVIMPMRI